MMKGTTKEIHKKIEKLPLEKRVEAEDFIEFLLSRERQVRQEKTQKKKRRSSLKGLWEGSDIDEDLFTDARKSVFTYEKHKS